jgi:hypothetical protein
VFLAAQKLTLGPFMARGCKKSLFSTKLPGILADLASADQT